MNEIMKTNNEPDELATIEQGIVTLAQRVEGMRDSEDAKRCLDDMKLLEAMLGQADRLGTLACQFAYLEARALATIARLEIEPPSRREMIAWLRTKTDDELNALLAECATGIRIGKLKARETRAENKARKEDAQIVELNRIDRELIEELEETGRTRIGVGEYLERWSLPEAPDNNALRGYVERTRDKALHRDAASTGDGNNDYLFPGVATRDELASIIENKLQSMHNDAMSLKSLLRGAGLALVPSQTAQLREDLDALESVDD